MRKPILWIVLLAISVLLSACAAGANPSVNIAAADGSVAGFWLGLWHGLIAPIAFLVSLFKDSVNVYEVHNNGGWYNFGYMLGLLVFGGGGGHGASRARR